MADGEQVNRGPEELEMDLAIVFKQDEGDLMATSAVQAREHWQAARDGYSDMVCLISALGQDGRKHRREATQVSEPSWLRCTPPHGLPQHPNKIHAEAYCPGWPST